MATLTGVALKYYGKEQLAEKYLTKAIVLDRSNPQRYRDLLEFYDERGYADRAVQYREELVKLDPTDPQAWYRLAVDYSQLGDVVRADEAYGRVERIVKSDSTVGVEEAGELLHALYNNWGFTLAEHSYDLDRARKLVAKALELDPDNPVYLDSMGWVLFKAGELDEARAYIERAISRGVMDAEIYEHMGDVFKALGTDDRARSYWTEAFKLNPDSRTLKEKLGR